MYKISKIFEFCYGHRVFSQKLDKPELSISTHCKCRHLHGHQGSLEVILEGSQLVDGMLTDFSNLTFVKQFIDSEIDHKMLLSNVDPFVALLLKSLPEDDILDTYLKHSDGRTTINPEFLEKLDNSYLKEVWEGLVLVPFVPTSENLAQWFFEKIEHQLDDYDIIVSAVIFRETPKTKALYY